MEIGTQIPHRHNFDKLCFSLREANMKHVELGPELATSLSLKEAVHLTQLLEKQGISVYSIHAPYGEKADLSAEDEKKRKKSIESHKKLIKNMPELQSSILVIHPGDKTDTEKIDLRTKLFCKSLEELLIFASEHKIKLALENMPPGFVGNNAQELKNILEKMNSSQIGICFDTGHAHIGGRFNEDFKTLQPYIVTFHVHDNDGLRDLHLQPPYGTILWDSFVEELQNMSFQNPVIMECFPWGKIEFEWAKREIEFLFNGKLIKNTSSPAGYIRCASCGHFLFEENGKSVCYCSFQGSANSFIFSSGKI